MYHDSRSWGKSKECGKEGLREEIEKRVEEEEPRDRTKIVSLRGKQLRNEWQYRNTLNKYGTNTLNWNTLNTTLRSVLLIPWKLHWEVSVSLMYNINWIQSQL